MNEYYSIVVSLALFIASAALEIGGGYLVWLWIKEHRDKTLGLAGACALFAYGVVPTFQTADFGRVYAAYGGVFIIGSIIALLGSCIIMYAPR